VTRLTITEALGDIKTINSRLDTHHAFINQPNLLARPGLMRDPLEKEGGSAAIIAKRLQSSRDLRLRLLNLRSAILRANQAATLTVEGITRTIADWIVWRRELAPKEKMHWDQIAITLGRIRNEAQSRKGTLKGEQQQDATQQDIILHVSELEIQEERERLEKILGTLDQQLSLKNATTFVEVAD
jgi:hypothetical protein